MALIKFQLNVLLRLTWFVNDKFELRKLNEGSLIALFSFRFSYLFLWFFFFTGYIRTPNKCQFDLFWHEHASSKNHSSSTPLAKLLQSEKRVYAKGEIIVPKSEQEKSHLYRAIMEVQIETWNELPLAHDSM